MAIHWWRTDRLVDELCLDHVTEHQSLHYAVIDAILITVGVYYANWLRADRSWPLVVEAIAVCVISVIGLHQCFEANGGSAGSHFLKRLLCLGVPIGLKFFIFSVVAGQLLYHGAPYIENATTFRVPYFVYQLGTSVFVAVLTALYYWRIAQHLARIATPDRSNYTPHSDARDMPASADGSGARAGGRGR
jgi:hypothetical protein